jgi:16S rRNA (guanine527-N7)-methyltransferase
MSPRSDDSADPRPAAPLSAAEFRRQADVSRETMERLRQYQALLAKWNRRINLVGRRSLDDVWRRHFLDSLQLLPHGPDRGPWLDLGSGAGFPGLVLAIAGAPEVHLVESDGRKCAFLREAARITGSDVTIHQSRIEDLPALKPMAVTARALAPLPRLLSLAWPQLSADTLMLLPKGQDVDVELTEAAKCWKMRVDKVPSVTASAGCILLLREITRVRSHPSDGPAT